MAVDVVYLGQSFTLEAKFYDNNAPFVTSESPRYAVRDFNNNLIASGVGTQDLVNSAKWTASITIPTSAPVTENGQRYSVIWIAKSDSKEKEHVEFFSVLSNIDFEELEEDRLLLEKDYLSDSLIVNSNVTVTSYTVRLLREDGTEIYNSASTSSAPVVQGSKRVYTHISEDTIDEMVVPPNCKPYLIEWTYITGGVSNREYHFLYIVNPRVLTYVHEVRRMIDKARSENPNPALQLKDTDLIAYLDQGCQLINGLKPVLTNYTISSMPHALSSGLINAAAYCALSAQYLAEGQAAFEFSGQAISLSIDRTQFIDSALSRIMTFIDEKIPTTKRLLVRSGSAGILGVNVGPSLGWAVDNWRYIYMRRLGVML